jgi:hypothetical protein
MQYLQPKWTTAKITILWVNMEARKEAKRELRKYNENCWMNYKSDIMWMVKYEPHFASLFDEIYNMNCCQFKRMAVVICIGIAINLKKLWSIRTRSLGSLNSAI